MLTWTGHLSCPVPYERGGKWRDEGKRVLPADVVELARPPVR